MRVAQVLLRYDAPGGVETHVRELSRELRRAGDEVRIYASDLWTEEGWVRRPEASRSVDGIEVERFPAVRRAIPGLTLPLLPGLVEALDRDHPEVIHAHSHRYGHVLQASWVARSRSIPFVVTTHYHPADPWEPAVKKGLLRMQDHFFGMTAYRQAGAVVAETRAEAAMLRDFVPADRLRIVPPGIDLEAWSDLPTAESARASLALPPGYLLFAGRLAPNKGLLTGLEAWAALPSGERPPWVLVGQDWGMRGKLEERARALGVEKDLRILGNLPDATAYRSAFAGATALILPSEYEAFGLVLLEAMAARLPVVATAVGGVPEAVEDGRTALLVPPRDVAALSAALRTVLTDPAKARSLGDAGRARVEARFSWRQTAERLRSIYREIAEGAPRVSPA
jgi:glycosyltransferase involved in cell wall biosynthesis